MDKPWGLVGRGLVIALVAMLLELIILAAAFVRNGLQWETLALCALSLVSLAALMAVYLRVVALREANRRWRDEELGKVRRAAYVEDLRRVATILESDDFEMRLATESVNRNASPEKRVEEARRLRGAFLPALYRTLQLIPAAPLGEEVQFNPNQHRTRSQLPPGAYARVIESGWRLGSDVIVKPTVERR